MGRVWRSSDSVERVCVVAVTGGGVVAVIGMVLLVLL
jgi:hypothetical protein